MNEITKTITKRKSRAIKPARISEDPDVVYAWKEIPVTQLVADKWARELDNWIIENPKAKTITQFYRSKGLQKWQWESLILKYTIINEANENALRELGERLWGKAVDRAADWKPVHFMLQNYAPEYDKSNKYHADLKKEVEAIASNFIVKMLQAQNPNKDKE